LLFELLVDSLIGGAKSPERAQLLWFLGTAVFGLLLSVMLLLQNLPAPLANWSDGSYYGFMFGTLSAMPGLPVGAVHFARYRGERR
jgi:hypothetical protein